LTGSTPHIIMHIEAIVIKKSKAREHDELITCYTKSAGKQVYHAKSVLRPKSKQAAHLQLLNLVKFNAVRGNGHPIIASAYSTSVFPAIKSSLPAMSVALFLLECFDRFIFEGQQDKRLWFFLMDNLQKINRLAGNPDTDWLGVIDLVKNDLLKTLGYDENYQIEYLANASLKSLHFAQKVIK
jgi:DNA repair protein RecO